MKCNLDGNTKETQVHTRYKHNAKKVKPVPLSDWSTPDASLDWRGRAIARAIPITGCWDEWFVPIFAHGARGGRLTPVRLQERWIGSIFRPKEQDALLGMQSNREYAVSWTWEELETISNEVEPPHHIRLESSHKVWEDCVFRWPEKVIPVEKEMIEDRVRLGLCEPAWGPYSNAHFLVLKKNAKHGFIISTMGANQHTLEDTGILSNVQEFSKAFAGLRIPSLPDICSGYDLIMLQQDSHDYMAFQTMPGMNHLTRLVQGATNWVVAFVWVSRKMPNPRLGSIVEILVDNVRVKGPKIQYGEVEEEGVPAVGRFRMEHF